MGGMILLADDSITIQKVVELTFAGTDSDVVAVGGGRELLARLPEVKPDVVLCDVVMPDMNGYDVCQAIKSDPATLHIPVVLLTGTFEPFDRERAIAVGCDSIVTKPFEARELVSLVEELLAKSAATRGQGAPIEPAAFEESAVPALDFTTTGFDKMVPPPPAEPVPPAEGLEMTGGEAYEPGPAPPPKPRTDADTQPVTPPAEAVGWQSRAETDAEGTETVVAGAPHVVRTEPFETPAASSSIPITDRDADVSAATNEPMTALLAAAPPPAAQPPAVPVAPVLAPTNGALSDDDVERVARKVLELSTPLLERVAWEVIPDMAEMLVRKRIRELESAADEES